MRAAVSAVLVVVLGCEPKEDTNHPDDGKVSKTADTVDRAEVAPGERLMYVPEGDPQSLVGREVVRDAEGHVVIARERKPGCSANVRRVDNAFRREYESELKNVAGFEASVRRMVELEGHYESGLRLRLSIHNEHVLRGDLEGDCGASVIQEVMVGTGSREVVQLKRGGGAVAVDLGPAGGGKAQGDRSAGEREALSWESPQAWAFKLSDGDVGRALLEIEMPETLVAEQPFQAKIRVNAPLWLVVLYRDAEGHHGVLLPRGRAAIQAAGDLVALPRMTPSNLEGHAEDREMLLVYGFTEQADFELFKPPAGNIDTARADEYAASLEQRLGAREIPRKRWTYADFTYVITAE